METGIIVLAHGSKVKSGTEGLYRIVDLIREMGGYKAVEAAFLQLAPPSLDEAVDGLIQRRCKQIIIMPLLLFTGNHVLSDIPRALDAQKSKYPDTIFIMARNIGPDPGIARIACERIEEVLHERE